MPGMQLFIHGELKMIKDSFYFKPLPNKPARINVNISVTTEFT